MASQRNGTLYVGVTSSLIHRSWQHRDGVISGFTKRYGCKLLVWFELQATMPDAIAREKKLALIEAMNPDWKDLFPGDRALVKPQNWIAPLLRSSQ